MHVFAWNCSIAAAIAPRSSEEKELEMVYGISTNKLPSALGHFLLAMVVADLSSVRSSKSMLFSCSSAYCSSCSVPPRFDSKSGSAPSSKSGLPIAFPWPSPGSNYEWTWIIHWYISYRKGLKHYNFLPVTEDTGKSLPSVPAIISQVNKITNRVILLLQLRCWCFAQNSCLLLSFFIFVCYTKWNSYVSIDVSKRSQSEYVKMIR